jgi:hypothetical protein
MQKLKNDKPKRGEMEFADLAGSGRLAYATSGEPLNIDRELIGCSAYSSGAVDYVTSGSPWGKLLIGAVVSLIPLIGQFFLAGYALRVTRNVMRGDYRLPEWDDFGNDIIHGFLTAAGAFVLAMLLLISMITIVMIPVVMIFGFPIVAYSTARYAITDDFTVFFDLKNNVMGVLRNFEQAIMLILGAIFLAFVAMLVVPLGYVFFFVPGLMASVAVSIAYAYQVGLYGRSLGIVDRR